MTISGNQGARERRSSSTAEAAAGSGCVVMWSISAAVARAGLPLPGHHKRRSVLDRRWAPSSASAVRRGLNWAGSLRHACTSQTGRAAPFPVLAHADRASVWVAQAQVVTSVTFPRKRFVQHFTSCLLL